MVLKILEKQYRKYFPKQLKYKNIYRNAVRNKTGIEIGGPSTIFERKGLLPIYDVIKNLDCCNFGKETVWEGKLQEGHFFKYDNNRKSGNQYIADAVNLSNIEDKKYDFVLSCHNLEHIANPLKALDEWRRILNDDGLLILVLPLKTKTFDHLRPTTTLAHLIKDFKNQTGEDDKTHFEEVIQYHDLSMDAGVNSKAELIARTNENVNNRCLHHHVFDPSLALEMVKEAKFNCLSISTMYHNIFLLARKIL